jgi:hypothetical protein
LCPALGWGRRRFSRFDGNLFYYFKSSLSKYCDAEDSFWRLMADAWVRGIVTNTDSWLLLFQTLPMAVMVEEFLRIFIAPIVAVLFSLLAILTCFFERRLPRNPVLLSATDVMTKWSPASKVTAAGNPPPPTLFRKRPMKDFLELISYAKDRQLRRLQYHRQHALALFQLLLRLSVALSVSVRVLCLISGVGPLIRSVVMFVGYSEVVNQHQSWFTKVTGLETGVRNSYLSDWLVARGTWHAVTTAKPLLEDVGRSTIGVLMATGPVCRRLAPSCFAVVGFVYATKYLVQKQNASSSSQWRDVPSRYGVWRTATTRA